LPIACAEADAEAFGDDSYKVREPFDLLEGQSGAGVGDGGFKFFFYRLAGLQKRWYWMTLSGVSVPTMGDILALF